MIGNLLRQNRCPQSGPATLSEDSEQKEERRKEGWKEGKRRKKEIGTDGSGEITVRVERWEGNKTLELHRLPLACDPFEAKAKNKLDY